MRVEITGLNAELRRNAQTVASITTAARSGRLPVARVEQLHARAEDEIALALEPFGYYRPTIRSQLDTTGSTWVARYQVEPGPALLLSRVAVAISGEGERDSTLEEGVTGFPLAAGDALRHDLYDQGKLTLAGLAAERGYLDAAFDTAQIRIDLEAYTAEIALHLSTGPRYSFGPVTFNQDIVDPSLLEGHVTFQPGDEFELSKLIALQRDLSSSPFFSQVEVRPIRENAEGRNVPIEVSAVPRKRQRYEVGAGYGTDTGFRGTLEVDFRRLNRKGHNATVRLEVSQIRRNIAGQYRFPPSYPNTANYALSVSAGDISPTWSSTLRLAFGASRSQMRGPLREVLSLSYDLQDFTVADRDGTSNLLVFGTSHSWLTADDRVLPFSGGLLQLDARGSIDALASSATYLQLIARGKLIKGIGGQLRFIGRLEVGGTFTSQFTDLPPTIRFVTGGDRTVRGYSFESLGPRDVEGRIVGGDVQLIASAEADCALAKKWRAAVFFDVGNALVWGGRFSVAKGAGLGARWVSPVGMVRVDVAYGFDEPSRGIRLHLTFGPDL
ncbi:MAG: BamA/TamA family outer membrane protein [Gemmatimonadota bacterium]|nr:MAG: BamA/TamA family outer membrane protein [Gemmatimonadota bacterium]